MTRKEEISVDKAVRILEQSGPLPPNIQKFLRARAKAVKEVSLFQENEIEPRLRKKEKRLVLLAKAHRNEKTREWDDKAAVKDFARTVNFGGKLAAEINHLRARRGIKRKRVVKIPYEI